MATIKGWFIRAREPNNLFWSLQPDAEAGWVTDLSKALLFARQEDAQLYFENCFHPSVQGQLPYCGN